MKIEEYLFDLEIYFLFRLLVDIRYNRLQSEEYTFGQFDTRWTPDWNLWSFYYQELYKKGVRVEVADKHNLKWVNLDDHISGLATKYKLTPQIPSAPEQFSELAYKIFNKFDFHQSDLYRLGIRIQFTISKIGEEYLQKRIETYLWKFVNNQLEIINEPRLKAEKQIEIVKSYIAKKAEIANPNNILVLEENIIENMTSGERMEEFSQDGRTIRLLEPLGLFWLAKYIDIEEINFVDENKPTNQNEGRYWFVSRIKLNSSVDGWTLDGLRKAVGLPSSHPKISILENRDYWYENGQLNFKLAGGGIDSYNFAGTRISKKLFEAFWNLWNSDGVGLYSREQVAEMYKSLHREELDIPNIGEIVSNIRASIINKKPGIKDRITWEFDKSSRKWLFKIFPLKAK